MPSSPLPEVLTEAIAKKRSFTHSGEEMELSSNIAEGEALTLYGAVRHAKPAHSVETGCAHGISSVAILQAIKDNGGGMHHVIDPFQRNYGDCGLTLIQRAGLEEWLDFHRKFPDEVIPSLPRLQFAFIDSSHLFDLTLAEFAMIDRRLDIGGIIGFHDSWMPSIQAVIRYILKNRAYTHFAQNEHPRRDYTLLQQIRRLTGATIGQIRRLRPFLSGEAVEPWFTLPFENLVLLQKSAEDTRDWESHEPF